MLGPEVGEEGDCQPADALALVLVGARESLEQQLQRVGCVNSVPRGVGGSRTFISIPTANVAQLGVGGEAGNLGTTYLTSG